MSAKSKLLKTALLGMGALEGMAGCAYTIDSQARTGTVENGRAEMCVRGPRTNMMSAEERLALLQQRFNEMKRDVCIGTATIQSQTSDKICFTCLADPRIKATYR
ncbi:hypothetical protein ACFL3C_04275 [Patescibacteria group bacterium]